jgi:hypothetical protein
MGRIFRRARAIRPFAFGRVAEAREMQEMTRVRRATQALRAGASGSKERRYPRRMGWDAAVYGEVKLGKGKLAKWLDATCEASRHDDWPEAFARGSGAPGVVRDVLQRIRGVDLGFCDVDATKDVVRVRAWLPQDAFVDSARALATLLRSTETFGGKGRFAFVGLETADFGYVLQIGTKKSKLRAMKAAERKKSGASDEVEEILAKIAAMARPAPRDTLPAAPPAAPPSPTPPLPAVPLPIAPPSAPGVRLRSRLAFAPTGLSVAYRASPKPQLVEIVARCVRKPQRKVLAGLLFEHMARCIAKGAGGGREFAPAQVRFERLGGPLEEDDARSVGREWRWKVKVAGLSPRYVRNVVEHLSLCGGGDTPLESLSVRGELPLDDGPMSVREDDVLGWLTDVRAWPGAWPAPGFAVKDVVTKAGVAVRVTMAKPITADVTKRMKHELLEAWSAEIALYAARDGTRGGMSQPSFWTRGATFELRYGQFTYEPGPTRDMLLNMLVWFHERVSPIAEVEMGFEG